MTALGTRGIVNTSYLGQIPHPNAASRQTIVWRHVVAFGGAVIATVFGRRDHVKYAAIGPIEVYFPDSIETNEQLQAENPKWDMDLIYSKTGIAQRHIAAADQCASDLGVAAAQPLFERHQVDPATVDFLLFCTQTPDYPLPTTACLVQERLGLPNSCGALDYNLGCSGFVYGIALADGLIRAGSARRVLLITAETYSKYIDASDRSLRTIFGDGAAATLIEAADEPSMKAFKFGTDGSGADTLIVSRGGARPEAQSHKPRHRQRWQSDLYMDGPSLLNFTVARIPELLDAILKTAELQVEDIDLFLMHQGTRKMLEQLQDSLGLAEQQLPIVLKECGNTVSSTIPVLINELRQQEGIRPGTRSVLAGFGVGWSWAGCVWTEVWPNA